MIAGATDAMEKMEVRNNINVEVLSSFPGHILAIVVEIRGVWLCVGGFNEIIGLAEKVGGRDRSARAMEEFKEVIDDCKLMDFNSLKHELTWCNKHEHNNVMERLDRGLCTVEWVSQFDGADLSLSD
uniref:Uncharacterized protein n=1 Tax=Cannabis sativa TaxID=3483 RepID=A0A803QJ16_CANSA